MASAALVVSRREESKAGLSLKNGPREVGFPQDPENPPISRSHIPFKIVARAPPRHCKLAPESVRAEEEILSLLAA